jgi:hypothetical protein
MAVTYKKIASVTVGSGGAANMDFTSIPATYTDLVIKISARGNNATETSINVSFNGSTANFSNRYVQGNGAAASSAQAARLVGQVTGTNVTANTFANSETYIPNYAGSTNKSFSTDTVTENNATTAYQNLSAGLWSNTAAINQITLTPASGAFIQYSTATLYGISNS